MDLECIGAKRARCESQRLPSGACGSNELLSPELVTGCKGTARPIAWNSEWSQGAVILGEGGLRPPEPLQPAAVQDTALPPGLASQRLGPASV